MMPSPLIVAAVLAGATVMAACAGEPGMGLESDAASAMASDAAGSDTESDLDAAPPIASDAPIERASPACPIQQTMSVRAGVARSAGFTGSDSSYFGLYGGPCQAASDCVPACVAAGGTMASCTAGSQCLPGEAMGGGSGCLPPTYWLMATGALSESGMTANDAGLILVDVPYDDALVATQFATALPDDAEIVGIQFQVRRATLAGNAVDETVKLSLNGTVVGTNHADPSAWPTTLQIVGYGGAYDLWGATLRAADVKNGSFGISITPKYTGPAAGNERAYVDSVRVSIYYRTTCEG